MDSFIGGRSKGESEVRPRSSLAQFWAVRLQAPRKGAGKAAGERSPAPSSLYTTQGESVHRPGRAGRHPGPRAQRRCQAGLKD